MSKPAAIVSILALCAGLRGCLILRAEVISQDGATYVRMARELRTDAMRVVREYNYHVGYPAALVFAHAIIAPFWHGGDIRCWELSGQLVSLAAGVLAVGAVWAFAARAFDRRTAMVAALLFGMARKWAALGADVLSDALAVCFQMWAAVMVLVALERLRLKRPSGLVFAAFAGICAGLGYLVRPECLAIAVVAAGLWLLYTLCRKIPWRMGLSAAAVTLTAALACAMPYMVAIGGLSKKKSIGELLLRPAAPCPMASAAASWAGSGAQALDELQRQFSEALHPLLTVFAGIWLIGWIVCRLGRSRVRLEVPSIRPDAGLVILGVGGIFGAVLTGMHMHVNYISHRHLMFPAGLSAGLAGAGVVLFAEILTLLARRIARRTVSRTTVLAVVAGLTAVGLAAHAARPLHAGKGYLRRTGKLLAELSDPQGYVLTDNPLVLHYAQVPGESLSEELILADWFPQLVRQSSATCLVLTGATPTRVDSRLLGELGPAMLVEIDGPRKRQAGLTDRVRLYRIRREGAPRRKGSAGAGQG